jgi:hypothetical protein
MMAPLAARASELKCHSISNEVTGHLVFDDGPGGLDFASLKVFNKNYELEAFDSQVDVIDMSIRDSFDSKFEYGGDELDVGFSGKDGMRLDIVASRIYGQVFDGTVYVKTSRNVRQRKIAFTCLEL